MTPEAAHLELDQTFKCPPQRFEEAAVHSFRRGIYGNSLSAVTMADPRRCEPLTSSESITPCLKVPDPISQGNVASQLCPRRVDDNPVVSRKATS
jgi:hypothetical protein